MISFLTKISNILEDLYKDEGKISSKRVMGTIGFISTIIFMFIYKDKTLATSLLYVSASLIGLDTIKKTLKGLKKNGTE